MKYTGLGYNKKTIGLLAYCSLFLILVFGLFFSPIIHAQSATATQKGTGNSIKISPLRTELTLRPGESRTVSVYVENLESKPVDLRPIENDFIAGDDESGAPSIILDEDKYAPTHSLKRFMQPLGVFTVQPSERKEVKVVIAVPRDAASGGYFGALRFAPAKVTNSEIVNVSASAASLIILTVPGSVTESMRLTKFDVMQAGKVVSRLSKNEGIEILLRLENKGNVQLAPYGNLSVHTGNNTEPLFTTNINADKPADLVLPDSARKFTIPVDSLKNFGKHTFKLVLSYGTNNETLEVERVLWIIPTTYIVGGVIGVTLLILLIVIIVLGLKAYKKRILRNARRR